MRIETEALRNVEEAIVLYETAGSAWKRRIGRELFAGYATPELVGALITEYTANAPTHAQLDALAAGLRSTADALDAYGTRPPAAVMAVITISGRDVRPTIRNGQVAFILTVDQQVALSATYTDAHGNPAQVESQTWASSDETVLAVTDNGDGTATAVATGTVGNAQINLTADARFGDEVNDIIGTLDVEVHPAEAVTATVTPGEPTDKPA